MTLNKPKWEREMEEIYTDGGDWEEYIPILERITRLLRRSFLGTDDPKLSDDIQREVDSDDD